MPPPLTADDPLFPSYIRMFKYEIMQFFTSGNDYKYYEAMRPAVGDELVDKVLECMKAPEEILKKLRPDMGIAPIPERVAFRTEETRKKYQQSLVEREQRIARARKEAAPRLQEESNLMFIHKILSTRGGIKAVDTLLAKYHATLWKMVHIDLDTPGWKPATLDMFKNFFGIKINEDNSEELLSCSTLDKIGSMLIPQSIYMYFSPPEISRENVIRTKSAPPAYCKMGIPKPKKCVNDNHWALAQLRSIPTFVKSNEPGVMDFIFESDDKSEDDNWKCAANKLANEIKKEEFLWQFVKACNTNPYNRAALYFILGEDYDRKIQEREDNLRAAERVAIDVKDENETPEETVKEDAVLQEMRPPADFLQFRDEVYFDRKVEITLRTYQTELVQSGIAGKSSIICAPTGSGKTEVAIYIAIHHLDQMKRQNKPARVAMIVPKIPLVDQQRKRFHKYVSGEYYVEGFQGYSSSRMNEKEAKRRDLVLACDITVFTPMVLVNMLRSVRENERLYVCDFSMLIFDEVHHCRADHPYNELMQIVHDYEGPKPQTIGLSASLLLEKVATRNKNDAIDKIYKLCANIGATCLDSVYKHMDDLLSVVPPPIDQTVKCNRPPQDKSPFRNALVSLLKRIELTVKPKLVKLTKENDTGQRLPPMFASFQDVKNTTRYRQHVIQLSQLLTRMKKDDDHELQDAVVATKYLRMIIEALTINEVMPAKYAFQQIEALFSELRKINTGTKIKKLFFDQKDELGDKSLEEIDLGHQPIVEELLKQIRQQFEGNKDSRVIIFVETRPSALRLMSFLNEEFEGSSQLRKKVGMVVSTNARKNVDGLGVSQTATDQKATLSRFETGDLKILVATSVVEEGLDVKSCNLIIKYNVASSAVQRMQKRGRARAEGGRCVLLVLDESLMNEEYQALMSERVMNSAIADIRKLGPTNLRLKVEGFMAENKKIRELDRVDRAKIEEQLKKHSYNIVCNVCDATITTSLNMRLLYSHFVSLDSQIWKRLIIELGDTKKALYQDEISAHVGHVRCRGGEAACGEKLGTVMRINDVYMPIFSIRQVKFVERVSGERVGHESEQRSKWMEVTKQLFYIPPAKQSELVEMLQTFSREFRREFTKLENFVAESDRKAAAKAQLKAESDARRMRRAEKGEWDDDDDGAELRVTYNDEMLAKLKEDKQEWDDLDENNIMTSRFQ